MRYRKPAVYAGRWMWTRSTCFPRVWVAVVGIAWTLLMAFSRTQVHAHWLTDTLGAMVLGVATTLLVAAALTIPVVRERERRLSLG